MLQSILPTPASTPTATTAAELLAVTAPVPVVTTAARSTCTDQSASTERPFKRHQRSVVPELMAPPPQVVVRPPPQVVVMLPPPALQSQQPGVMLLPAESQPQPAVQPQ